MCPKKLDECVRLPKWTGRDEAANEQVYGITDGIISSFHCIITYFQSRLLVHADKRMKYGIVVSPFYVNSNALPSRVLGLGCAERAHGEGPERRINNGTFLGYVCRQAQ